jgi:hypothetical protein
LQQWLQIAIKKFIASAHDDLCPVWVKAHIEAHDDLSSPVSSVKVHIQAHDLSPPHVKVHTKPFHHNTLPLRCSSNLLEEEVAIS